MKKIKKLDHFEVLWEKRVLYLPAGSNVSGMFYAGVDVETGSGKAKSVFHQSASFQSLSIPRWQPYFVSRKKSIKMSNRTTFMQGGPVALMQYV